MERYKKLEELGDGTSGTVYKALQLEACEIVAVKKMKRKFFLWDECLSLRELKSLSILNHPNLIKLKEVVWENNELFFIFEYMEYTLYQRMKDKPLSEQEIRSFMYQILLGLAHMHRNGYFHRDLKPENLLINHDIIKIADFGLVREVSSVPPYTEYVSTRWYRAPEVLLHHSSYTPAIDMWAIGTIMAELFTLCPIFPGESEIDQLFKICSVLGVPDWSLLSDTTNVTQLQSIYYSEVSPPPLSEVIPDASMEALDLIMQLCSWDPRKRPTAEQALQHPFFQVCSVRIPYLVNDPFQFHANNAEAEPNLDLNLWDFGSREDECFLGLTLAVKPTATDLEMIQKVSQGIAEDMVVCSGFPSPRESVFWPFRTPDPNRIDLPVDLQLSLSFSPIMQPPIGVPQSAGCSLGSLRSDVKDRPWLAISTPFPQGRWL